jgi:DNA replication protein DnaD
MTQHATVHNKVKEYMDKSAMGASNVELKKISQDIEHATIAVFKGLNQVKIDNGIAMAESSSNSSHKQISHTTTQSIKPKQVLKKPVAKTTTSYTQHTHTHSGGCCTPPKMQTITPSKSSKDDEWEAF